MYLSLLFAHNNMFLVFLLDLLILFQLESSIEVHEENTKM